ncbi:hypothetical protein THAOC_05580, partial [Thalassiosira oceanica]
QIYTIQSALFNPDVAFRLAALLDARDLCQFSLTCKTLGGKQAAPNGLSLIEEAARQQLGCASEWERSCLPKYVYESWIELYHHLLMLRSKLTFDKMLVGEGRYRQHGADLSIVHTILGQLMLSSALCSNHVMRFGRHFAVFKRCMVEGEGGNSCNVGVVRSVQIDRSDFGGDGKLRFSPVMPKWEKQTGGWIDSNVHCCDVVSLVVSVGMTGKTGHRDNRAGGLRVSKAKLRLGYCLIWSKGR